ncbi:SMI1/KNR4 family protein [Streptomyces sp. NRRL F-5630]|uniref:SMI1/KNR4 family protein n=1 Tax=Streptomyces sp. NRRL F-5630 TaxID=1463864 RepID=UPI003D7164FD
MTRADLTTFDQAWERFARSLAAHSPADHAALRPPATAEEIAGLEAQLGFVLHPELRALLERHNGAAEPRSTGDTDPFPAGAFLPLGHRLMNMDEIAAQHRWCVGFKEDNLASGLWHEEELQGHAHQWVPLARPNDGGIAFVDHRPGETYGHVYEIGIGSGDIDGSEWGTCLAEFFDGLAGSLETGEPFLHYVPGIYEHPSGKHCVDWEIDD